MARRRLRLQTSLSGCFTSLLHLPRSYRRRETEYFAPMRRARCLVGCHGYPNKAVASSKGPTILTAIIGTLTAISIVFTQVAEM